DLEKALRHLIERGLTDSLVILGLHGKRTDHTLTNLSVLVRFRDQFKSVISIDQYQSHYLLTEKHPSFTARGQEGNRISTTPLPAVSGVTTKGLFYPLEDESMSFGHLEGLSNIIAADIATVSISSGSLLISLAHKS
ncbi:MAG TPA: thiamine diphosphokinase, partial [Candidatus Kapabacteria bacterium]|nr:thiamine diphosphokinase [Candidatus Kapabacteria bacterium]